MAATEESPVVVPKRPPKTPVPEEDAAVAVESSVLSVLEPRRPPKIPVPLDDSVALVAAALWAESVDDPSKSDAREPTRPAVPVLDPEAAVVTPAETTGELGTIVVLFSESVVEGAVDDKETGDVAFSVIEVASLREAEEVVEAVP